MTPFNPADAALEGFRIVKDRPSVLPVWAAMHLLVSLVGAYFMVSGGFLEANARIQELSLQMNPVVNPNADPAASQAMLGELLGLYSQMFGAIMPTIALSIVMMAVLLPAIYRMVLRPSETSPGYIRLGGAELRQAVVGITIAVIMTVAYVGGAIVLGIVGALLGMLLGSVFILLLPFLIIFGLAPLMVFLWVKLSLAGPQTFAENRINIFGSWRLTKGRFWPILGAYVIAVILVIVVTILGLVVALVPAVVLGGGMDALETTLAPKGGTVGDYFSPGMIGYMVIMALVSTLTFPVSYAPAAAVYRSLTGAVEAETFV